MRYGLHLDRYTLLSAVLPFAYLKIFHDFSSSADLLFKLTFSNKSFVNTTRVSNRFDLDQARLFVRPDLGPNCLQGLSADDTSK